MRSRSGSSADERLAAERRRERRRRLAQDRAGRQQLAHPAARLLAHQRGAGALARRDRARPRARLRATLNWKRGFARSIQSLKVSHASEGCSVRCALAQAARPGGAIASSLAVADQPAEPRRRAAAAPRRSPASASANASVATISRRRQLRRDRLAEHDRRDAGEGLGVAGEPAGRVGARRLAHHAA